MRIANVLQLGVKELRSLWRDPAMLVLIVYAFTLNIYAGSSAMPETLNRATIAIVDEDNSPLSSRITQAFTPPYFVAPHEVSFSEVDARLDAGLDTFALDIPPDFQRDLLAGRRPALQLNVDATRMTQAFSGSGYIQQIVAAEIAEYSARYRSSESSLPVDLILRARFNPALDLGWFGAVNELITAITMLSIVLTGAALIREKEHGTVEHLLVMPVSALEIMLSKIWSMGLVVLVATAVGMAVVLQWALGVPLQGSPPLFLLATVLMLYATTAMGICIATLAGTMPQFGLLLILVLIPLQMLSGGMTPRESMPEAIQIIMLAAPNTHFVILSQAILFRGAGIETVWPQLLALAAIGSALFWFALLRFRAFLR